MVSTFTAFAASMVGMALGLFLANRFSHRHLP